ncbi:MAG: LacI family DNA-binding transcriptional regulator [Clostridia bacterium]|nr:LacI family DNA-binding transcriptional regulator [Clostridia bacterium]
MAEKNEVTIYDIASEAGVSVATVSRVLTGNARVKPDKKERIEALIKKYDFRPNTFARNLSSSKTRIIGIITADIRNPFYSNMVVECEAAADLLDYTLVICNSLGKKENEYRLLDKLEQQQVDAVILIGGSVDKLVTDLDYADRINRLQEKIPVVITGKLDGTDCYQVNIDEGKNLSLAMEYIISLGHKEIAFIGGRDDVKSTVDKRLRYRQMLRRYGIPFHEENIINAAQYDDEGGYNATQKLFGLKKMPSAIISINDFTAVGILRALTEKGFSVPDDVSLVSFDNTFVSELAIPRLTSVGYNYKTFGEQLVRCAVDAAEGGKPQKTVLIEPDALVIRDSCQICNANKRNTNQEQ